MARDINFVLRISGVIKDIRTKYFWNSSDIVLSDGFNVKGGGGGGLERNLKEGCGEAFSGGCFVVFFEGGCFAVFVKWGAALTFFVGAT